MLAAATSSRPAVTRRAYECGGADTDVESIATDSPAMRSGTAHAAGDAREPQPAVRQHSAESFLGRQASPLA